MSGLRSLKREGETTATAPQRWAAALAIACLVLLAWAGPARAAPPALAAGRDFSLAVDDQGVLRGWGQQVASGSTLPRRVNGLPTASKIFAGGHQVFVIDRQTGLWAWGDNVHGQLGDGTRIPRAIPVQVGSGFASVSTNLGHTLAIKTDGSLWGWGNGLYGTLGNGQDFIEPVPILIGEGYSEVAAGYEHSIGLKTDGSVWVWGRNQQGQLGTGGADVRVPTPLGLAARAIAAGYDHCLMLQANGDLWAWGDNSWGQVGNDEGIRSTRPAFVGSGYVAIHAKGRTSMALKADGSLWIWGAVAASNETSYAYRTPTLLASNVASFSAGFDHGLVQRSTGQVLAFGSNLFGQLGIGSTRYQGEPVEVGIGYAAVAGSEYVSVALTFGGAVWTWGDDFYNQLGDGPPESKTTPAQLGTGYKAVSVGFGHRLALKTNGSIWSWGYSGPALGLGVVGHQFEPQRVGGPFTAIAAGGGHSLALKADGTLWVWGSNSKGQLGFSTAGQWEPTQLGSAQNRYVAIAAGFNHSFGLRADGSLWGWGSNDWGQLGLGDTVDRATPALVGTGFTAVASGGFHTVALKADGSLWAWGGNFSGQLGLGHFIDQRTPTLVGTGFVKIQVGENHTLALKTDGTLWAWGENAYFQLGNGTAVDSADPVLIGSNYLEIGSGPTAQHSLALRKDGSVWIWGDNASGQLGEGTVAAAARPIAVVNETATGLLSLVKGAVAGNASDRLVFLLNLQKQGYDVSTTLSDLRATGILGDVYFTALLPKDSPLLRCSGGACGASAADARKRTLRAGSTRGPFSSLRPLDGTTAPGMVSGVFSRGGFKQTGGTGYAQADKAFSGDLGRSGPLSVYSGVGDPLTGSNAVICMGVTIPDLSAKGQVLMRPIATGTAVQGVVQCPPVQTAATIAQFRAEASGAITARSIAVVIEPLAEDRGKTLKLFAWAVAPDGRQFMQSGPDLWEDMAEPVRPAATVTLPASGSYRHEVARGLNLTGLEGTLVFIGLGQSWDEVRSLNKAGHPYTVQ